MAGIPVNKYLFLIIFRATLNHEFLTRRSAGGTANRVFVRANKDVISKSVTP